MSTKAEDLSIEYEEDGIITRKQKDREILSKGAWTTILFCYQELIPETGEFGSDKYIIQRYQKVGGEYRLKSKFKISSPEQAKKIIKTLSRWIGDDAQ